MANITNFSGQKSLRQTMAQGLKALGGKEVPNYTLLYLDNAKNKKTGDYQTIVVPYIEIGRGPTCVIQYGDNYSTVHRKHAAITWEAGQVTIKHLGTNPLLINGIPVRGKQVLQNADEIQFSQDGPRLRFNSKQATTGGMKFTARMAMFAQQALKPYKYAVWTLSSVIIGLLTWSVYSGIQYQKDKAVMQKTIAATMDSLKVKETKMLELGSRLRALNKEYEDLAQQTDVKDDQLREVEYKQRAALNEIANLQSDVGRMNQKLTILETPPNQEPKNSLVVQSKSPPKTNSDNRNATIKADNVREEEPDSDGDGIIDIKDDCPFKRGVSQNNGCPLPLDSDGDGIIDTKDECPGRYGPIENNGCPIIKSDNSAIGDEENEEELSRREKKKKRKAAKKQKKRDKKNGNDAEEEEEDDDDGKKKRRKRKKRKKRG